MNIRSGTSDFRQNSCKIEQLILPLRRDSPNRMLERILKLQDVEDDSLFLWGSRQTGKSTLLKARFPKARLYDLLKTDLRMAFQLRPALLREECELLDEGELDDSKIYQVSRLVNLKHDIMTNTPLDEEEIRKTKSILGD